MSKGEDLDALGLCKTNVTEIQRKDISFLLSKTKDAFAVRKAMAPCSKLIFRK
ncbi:unnamed protein product [Porites lobata]|uniref:Uncharacterized protein n=1 Tax=Porites lobata TaxID=104759 RepID=A0ABN8NNB5_9CNID|nr:unnamed protein product [Porites lobata]